MEHLADRPYWRLEFTADGELSAPDRDAFLREVADSGIRDLFVLSHGWGASEANATALYRNLLPMIARRADGVAGLGPVGLVGVYWPALWFPDRPAPDDDPDDDDSSGGHAQSFEGRLASASSAGRLAPASAEGRLAPASSDGRLAPASSDGRLAPAMSSGDEALSGEEIAATLRLGFDADQQVAVDRLGQLIDEGAAAAASGGEPDEVQRARLDEFHQLLTTLYPPRERTSPEDSGERTVLATNDPEGDYALLASRFGGVPEGGAGQGLGDVFGKVWKGAKDVLRITSYYVMKARAGEVGRNGLGPLLADLHAPAGSPQTRVHLIGHSFGGRLVSFALAGIPSAQASPIASLTLIQAAFSHFAFSAAADNPFEEAGALHRFVDRVRGPLVATFSPHDFAVGRWYPRASALARQDNEATPEVSRWGGLGASGFQAVAQLEERSLLAPGDDYALRGHGHVNVDGSKIISTRLSAFAGAHSDIERDEIAWLVVSAACASG